VDSRETAQPTSAETDVDVDEATQATTDAKPDQDREQVMQGLEALFGGDMPKALSDLFENAARPGGTVTRLNTLSLRQRAILRMAGQVGMLVATLAAVVLIKRKLRARA
jgi:hypothetical protein